jgi:hypothetical protein
MNRKRLIGSIAAACAAAALTAGIAEGSGTTTQSSTATQPSTTSGAPMPGHDGHGGPPGGRGPGGGGGGAVHSVDVVLNKAKTAYITQTSDEGTIESVDSSGGSITLLEGTKAVTYKTVTVTVPSSATVTLDGKSSTLSALVAGDRVSVMSVLRRDRRDGGGLLVQARRRLAAGRREGSGATRRRVLGLRFAAEHRHNDHRLDRPLRAPTRGPERQRVVRRISLSAFSQQPPRLRSYRDTIVYSSESADPQPGRRSAE